MPSTPDRLEPCPATPNCVSTQAERPGQRMDPIPFSDDPGAVRERLLAMLAREPRVRVEEATATRVHATFTTRILRFRDDVVFLLDPRERVIHFRSASRIGRSDWGANRARMARLSALLRQTGRSGE